MERDYEASLMLLRVSGKQIQLTHSHTDGDPFKEFESVGLSGNLDLDSGDLSTFKSALEPQLRLLANAHLRPETAALQNKFSVVETAPVDSHPDDLSKSLKERNRQHAKLTRDRKKIVQKLMVSAISNLEEEAKSKRTNLKMCNFPVKFYKEDLIFGSRLDCLQCTSSSLDFHSSLGLPKMQKRADKRLG